MAMLNLLLHGGTLIAIDATRVLFVFSADVEEGDSPGTCRVYFGGGDNDFISVRGELDEIVGLIEKSRDNERKRFNFAPDPSARW